MPIKILFFIENLRGGGAEKVLCDLVNRMDQNRFAITVQTLWKADAAQFLKPGIRYRYCYSDKGTWNNLRSRLEAAAGWTYPLHIKGDYDIEVAYLECGTTKILAGSTNKHAKKLAWVHCNLNKAMPDPQDFAKRTAAWYEKYDRIVCVSQSVKENFDALFGNRFDSVVLRNVIDDEQIRSLSQADLPMPQTDGLPVLCAVGRLAEPKNYLRLLRAHRQLLSEGLTHRLWIVGEGPERPKLEAFLAGNELQTSVTLAGFQSNPYPYMAQSDLLVCSSDYEGLSTFVSEGLVLGKPIVTTNCGGMDELLGASEYGLITANHDSDFTDGLRRMLQDVQLRSAYAQKAKARGEALSAASQMKTVEQFFLQLLN